MKKKPERPEHIREIKLGQADWKDRNGLYHWVIGERAHTQDPGTLLTYTRCGCADVPWDEIQWLGEARNRGDYGFCTACLTFPDFAKQPRPRMVAIHSGDRVPGSEGLFLEVTAAQEPEPRLVFRIGPHAASLTHEQVDFLCGWLRAHTAPGEGADA